MGSVGRIFVAVGMDDVHRHDLAAYLHTMMGELPGKATPPENWHVTLRFMGEMDDAEFDRFVHELDGTYKPGPFRLTFAGLGAFPKPSKASVLWLGIDHGRSALVELASATDEAAVAIGKEPEDRPFRPHLSLARIRPPLDVWSWLEREPNPPLKIDVAAVGVYRSHLGGPQARYELVETCAL